MLFSAGCLNHLVRNPSNVVRHVLVQVGAQAQLPVLALAANEQAADVVNEGGVVATSTDVLQVRLVVLVEVDHCWSPVHRHDTATLCATLAPLVLAPGKGVTLLSTHDCVVGAAGNLRGLCI